MFESEGLSQICILKGQYRPIVEVGRTVRNCCLSQNPRQRKSELRPGEISDRREGNVQGVIEDDPG